MFSLQDENTFFCTDQSCAWLCVLSLGGSGLTKRDTCCHTDWYSCSCDVMSEQGSTSGIPNRDGRFFCDDRKYESIRNLKNKQNKIHHPHLNICLFIKRSIILTIFLWKATTKPVGRWDGIATLDTLTSDALLWLRS